VGEGAGERVVSVLGEETFSHSFLWDELVSSKRGRKAKRLGGGRLLGMGGRGAVLVRAGGTGGGGTTMLCGLSSDGAGGGGVTTGTLWGMKPWNRVGDTGGEQLSRLGWVCGGEVGLTLRFGGDEKNIELG